MKTIKVLGTGCSNCEKTSQLIQKIADEMGVPISLQKVTDLGAIMGYGVLSTPGVVVDETLVHSGGIPRPKEIQAWLEGAPNSG